MVDDDYWTSTTDGFDFGNLNYGDFGYKDVDFGSIAISTTTVSASKNISQSQKVEETSKLTSSDSHGSCSSLSQASIDSDTFQSLSLRGSLLKLSPVKDVSTSKKLTPQQTVQNILLGLDYCFEPFKTRAEKIALLDSAIQSYDGNAITAVTLFLRSTLKKSIFQKEILERREARNHYLHYLKLSQENEELDNMLIMLGLAEDAAMLKYSSAIKVEHPESKIRKLENCLTAHFQPGVVYNVFVESLWEHIKLLQRQNPIEEDDAKQELLGTNDFLKMCPRKHSLFDVSVISTLFYCCLYHYHLTENHFASPVAIRKSHQLTDEQFVWTALSALAQLNRWEEIENLFMTKKLFGGTKMRCCIGFHNAVAVLASHNAPSEILHKYIRLVENIDDRVSLAKKFKFHHLVLEILTNLKDRQQLLAYQSELSPSSIEYMEVREALTFSSAKWKK